MLLQTITKAIIVAILSRMIESDTLPTYTLETQYEEGVGEYDITYGAMFTVFSLKNITITSLDIHTSANGKIRCMVYTQRGSYADTYNSIQGWDLVFNETVKSNGVEEASFLPPKLFTSVDIIADDVIGQSFYVTLDEPKLINLKFTGMVTDETIFSSNSDLKLLAGISVNTASFSSDITKNMVWSGAIWYTTDELVSTLDDIDTYEEQPQLITNFKGEKYFYGSFFDIYAMKTVIINSLDIHTASLDNVTVEVWSKVNTFRLESEDVSWELVANTTIKGYGRFITSSIPTNEFKHITIQGRKTQSFYVTLSSQELICSEERKLIAGEDYATNDDLWLFLGAGIDSYPIDLNNPLDNAIEQIGFNGIVKYTVDPNYQESTNNPTKNSPSKIPVNAPTSNKENSVNTTTSNTPTSNKENSVNTTTSNAPTSNNENSVNTTTSNTPTSIKENSLLPSNVPSTMSSIFEPPIQFTYLMKVNSNENNQSLIEKHWINAISSLTNFNFTKITVDVTTKDDEKDIWCKEQGEECLIKEIELRLQTYDEIITSDQILRISLMELAKSITKNDQNTYLGPDIFNSEFIFSLTGIFDDKELSSTDKSYLQSTMLTFLKNGFDDCYCGIHISDVNINRYTFKTSTTRHLNKMYRSSYNDGLASLDTYALVTGEMYSNISSSSSDMEENQAVNVLVLNLFLNSGSDLVNNITSSNIRFQGVKYITSLDYGSSIDTPPKFIPGTPMENNEENGSSEGDYFFYIVVSISALAIIFGTFVIRRCVIKRHVRRERKAELKKSKSRPVPRRSTAGETCEISALNSVRNDRRRSSFLSEVSDDCSYDNEDEVVPFTNESKKSFVSSASSRRLSMSSVSDEDADQSGARFDRRKSAQAPRRSITMSTLPETEAFTPDHSSSNLSKMNLSLDIPRTYSTRLDKTEAKDDTTENGVKSSKSSSSLKHMSLSEDAENTSRRKSKKRFSLTSSAELKSSKDIDQSEDEQTPLESETLYPLRRRRNSLPEFSKATSKDTEVEETKTYSLRRRNSLCNLPNSIPVQVSNLTSSAELKSSKDIDQSEDEQTPLESETLYPLRRRRNNSLPELSKATSKDTEVEETKTYSLRRRNSLCNLPNSIPVQVSNLTSFAELKSSKDIDQSEDEQTPLESETLYPLRRRRNSLLEFSNITSTSNDEPERRRSLCSLPELTNNSDDEGQIEELASIKLQKNRRLSLSAIESNSQESVPEKNIIEDDGDEMKLRRNQSFSVLSSTIKKARRFSLPEISVSTDKNDVVIKKKTEELDISIPEKKEKLSKRFGRFSHPELSSLVDSIGNETDSSTEVEEVKIPKTSSVCSLPEIEGTANDNTVNNVPEKKRRNSLFLVRSSCNLPELASDVDLHETKDLDRSYGNQSSKTSNNGSEEDSQSLSDMEEMCLSIQPESVYSDAENSLPTSDEEIKPKPSRRRSSASFLGMSSRRPTLLPIIEVDAGSSRAWSCASGSAISDKHNGDE